MSAKQSDVCTTGWRQTNAVRSGGVQRVDYGGREYLRFPIVPLTEMVLEYPERNTREYLPAEHIAETVSLWDGTPLTYVHPKNREKSVRDPDAYAENVIGAFHNPEIVDGKLRGDGIVDVAKAEELGGQAAALVDDLRSGEEVQVSAGYGTVDDETRPGRFDGKQYDLTQGPPLPDHVAVFPNDSGAVARCSPEDGCAAPRANANESETETMSQSHLNLNDADEESDTAPSKAEQIETMRRELAELREILKDALGSPSAQQTNTCGCGQASEQTRANMAGVAGSVSRDLDRGRDNHHEDPEEYPAGGRRSWERRQVGLEEVPDESDEYPSGGRSSWEARKQEARTNAERSAAETELSAGARRSLSARQNAVESSEWRAAEYPLTAMRKQQEREEKRQRWEELKEQARRTDTNTVRKRHNGS